MELLEFDNFIFDLYGTLIDIHTDEYCDETWKRWLLFLDKKKIKHPCLAVFRDDFFKKDKEYRLRATMYEYPEIDILKVYDELFTLYGNQRLEESELFEISYQFRVSSRDHFELFEDVRDFLNGLKRLGKKIYILSNAQRSYTLYEIRHFGLDRLVDDFLISSDYGCMKPDRAFYGAIVEKHSLDKNRTVMLGDSLENDYRGAIDAGLNAIWLGEENAAEKFYKKMVSIL